MQAPYELLSNLDKLHDLSKEEKKRQAPYDLQSYLDKLHDLSKEDLFELICKRSQYILQTGIYEIGSSTTAHLARHPNFSLLSSLCDLYSGNANRYGYVQIEPFLSPDFLPKLAYCWSQPIFNIKKVPFSLRLDLSTKLTDEQLAGLKTIFQYIARLEVRGNEENLLEIAATEDCQLQSVAFESVNIIPDKLNNLMTRFPGLNQVEITGAPHIAEIPNPTLNDARASGPWGISMRRVVYGATVRLFFVGCDLPNMLRQLESIKKRNPDVIISMKECSALPSEFAQTLPQLANLSGGTSITTAQCTAPSSLPGVNQATGEKKKKWVLSRNLLEIKPYLIIFAADEDLTVEMMQSFIATTSNDVSQIKNPALILRGPAVTRWLKLNTPQSFDSVRKIHIQDATLSTEDIQSERLKQRLTEWFPLVEELTFLRLSCPTQHDKQLMLAQVLSLSHLKQLNLQIVHSDAELIELATLISPNKHLECLNISEAPQVTGDGLNIFAARLQGNSTIKSIKIGDKHSQALHELSTRNQWLHKNFNREAEIILLLEKVDTSDQSLKGCIALYNNLDHICACIDEMSLYYREANAVQSLYGELVKLFELLSQNLCKLPDTPTAAKFELAKAAFRTFSHIIFGSPASSANAATFSSNNSTAINALTALSLQSVNHREIIDKLAWIINNTDETGYILLVNTIADVSQNWQVMEYAMSLMKDRKHSHPSVFRHLFVQYAKLIHETVSNRPETFLQSGNDMIIAFEQHCVVLSRENSVGQSKPFFDEEARKIIFSALFRLILMASQAHFMETRPAEPITQRPPHYLPNLVILSRCENILRTIEDHLPRDLYQNWSATFFNVCKSQLLLLIAAEYQLRVDELLVNNLFNFENTLAGEFAKNIHRARGPAQLTIDIEIHIKALGIWDWLTNNKYHEQLNNVLQSLEQLTQFERSMATTPVRVQSKDKDTDKDKGKDKTADQTPEIPPKESEAQSESPDLQRQAALLLANRETPSSIIPAIRHTLVAPPKPAAKAVKKGLPKIETTEELKENPPPLQQHTKFHDML